MRQRKKKVCVSRAFCVIFLLQHFAAWNLVEQKSVLDCRRISRNFSQKRGQQKRPKQNREGETLYTRRTKKKEEQDSFVKSHFFSSQTTHDHQYKKWIENHFFSRRRLSYHNWDLVDSASSHMLVSRTKPCMPQNHCIAGICAWLITSDVICRKNFAVSAYWIPWRNAKLIHEQTGFLRSTVWGSPSIVVGSPANEWK